jgi:hypothetical protein
MKGTTKLRRRTLLVSFSLVLCYCWSQASQPSQCLGPRADDSAKIPFVAESVSQHEGYSPALPENSTVAPKSPGKAFFLSLLVPGWGELYAGSSTKGKIFLAAEAAVWSGFAAFEQYSAWKRRDYELYAVDHADLLLDGKDDEYFKNVAAYTDIWSYNDDQLHAREWESVYWDEEFYHWRWENPESKEKFNEIRDSSRRARRRALNMVGAAVLNRLISSIDAVRTAKAFNSDAREYDTGVHLGLKLRGSLRNPKALLVLNKSF